MKGWLLRLGILTAMMTRDRVTLVWMQAEQCCICAVSVVAVLL